MNYGIEYTVRISTGETIEVLEVNEPNSRMDGSDYLIENGYVTVFSTEDAKKLRMGNDSSFKKLAKGEPTRCLIKVEPQKCANHKSCPALNKSKCYPKKFSIPFCWESSHSDKNVARLFSLCVSAWALGQWVIFVRDDNYRKSLKVL